MSPLLKRLKGELSAATDRNYRVELLSLIACDLARQGNLDEARSSVAQARAALSETPGSMGTVWVMLAEGLLQFFVFQNSAALDRIKRAQTLGLSLRYSRLVAIVSAWRAHIEFDSSEFDAMVRSLLLAREHSDGLNHDAETRIAMIISNSFAVCGDRVQQQKWFKHAHRHAIDNGDQASVEASIYNGAALTLARLRVDKCLGGVDPDVVRRVRMELTSSVNLTSLVGAALTNYLEFVGARLLLLEERYEEAIAKLQTARQQTPFAANNFDQAYIDLEVCYCRFRLNDEAAVSKYSSSNPIFDFPFLDIDEQIVALWMRWQMALTDTRFGNATDIHSRLDEMGSDYTRSRGELLASLEPFLE